MIGKNLNIKRKVNIIRNISFLLEENGESKSSFSQKTGVSRATLHNILKGKVTRIQQSTVNRISDFFGLPCEIIETIDLSRNKRLEEDLSYKGNKNPIAVPIIPLSILHRNMSKPVGTLVEEFKTTHYFGDFSNTISIFIDIPSKALFTTGTQLIVSRSVNVPELNNLLFTNENNDITIVNKTKMHGAGFNYYKDRNIGVFLGVLIEEKYSEI